MGRFGVVSKPKHEFSVEDLKKAFPAKKDTITEELAEMINDAQQDPSFNGNEFMEALVTYQDVMTRGSYSLKEYINAIKYCAYLESEGNSQTEAYKRARANDEFVIERRDASTDSVGYRELTSAASRYHKTAIVRQILTQSDMPLYLMFQGERYRAVALLAREMMTAAYSKDRITAADKLLTHVKPPENVNVELQVGPNQEAKDLGAQLSEQLAKSVAMQRAMLEAGIDLATATKTGISLNDDIIDVEVR